MPSIRYTSIWSDFIFLGDQEKARFIAEPNTYLINQVQNQTESVGTNTTIRLDFNKPVKELITQLDDANHDKLEKIKIVFDGQKRIEREASYFSSVQRYQHHTGSKSSSDKEVYIYSFALEPEDKLQPSGSCNLSTIQKTEIELTGSTIGSGATADVYAVNYNILRIQNGRAFIEFH
jgi:hypothetical protein